MVTTLYCVLFYQRPWIQFWFAFTGLPYNSCFVIKVRKDGRKARKPTAFAYNSALTLSIHSGGIHPGSPLLQTGLQVIGNE
jgi:hypothetical protein